MSHEENKSLIRRYFQEALVEGNTSAVDEVLSPSFVNHDPPPGVSSSRDGIKQVIALLHTVFPDFRIDIQDMTTEGEKVVVRSLIGGTQKREFLGKAPTGQVTMIPITDVFRVVDGKIVERWG